MWSGEWGATAKSTVRYGRGTYVPCNTQDNEKRFEKKKKKNVERGVYGMISTRTLVT